MNGISWNFKKKKNFHCDNFLMVEALWNTSASSRRKYEYLILLISSCIIIEHERIYPWDNLEYVLTKLPSDILIVSLYLFLIQHISLEIYLMSCNFYMTSPYLTLFSMSSNCFKETIHQKESCFFFNLLLAACA